MYPKRDVVRSPSWNQSGYVIGKLWDPGQIAIYPEDQFSKSEMNLSHSLKHPLLVAFTVTTVSILN